MVRIIDISGKRFGRLVAISKSEKLNNSGASWNCLCDCGKYSVVNSLKLRSGKIVSCGCKRAEGKSHYIHGMANKSKTYSSWKNMRFRCMNERSAQWKWYGGRGIKVCSRWDDFELFLLDMGDRPKGSTIDRINPDGDYEPKNCRWASASQQAETNRGTIKAGSVAHNKWPQSKLNEMVALRKSGFTLKEISRLLGGHISTISTKLKDIK